MKDPLFVTGATGRVGRRFVHAAVQKGHPVTALVRDAAFAKDLFSGLDVELVRGDLSSTSADVLADSMAGKIPVHLAAVVNFYVPASQLWDVNVEGTRRLVSAAQTARVRRFIHMSSTGIYHRPSYLPIDEDQPPSPMAGYGETKLDAEKIVRQSNLDYIMLRAPAIYGPGFDEGFTQVLEWVRKGKMVIMGSGKNRVPLIHVDDVVAALLLAVENRKIHQDAFIITSGEEYTQEQCLSLLAQCLGVSEPKKHVPVAVAYGMVAVDALSGLFTGRRKLRKLYVDFLAEDRVFDISKAEEELGYSPKVTLEQGIRQYLQSSEKT